MEKGEVRLSSILVSGEEGLRLYRSFEEVPEAVRRRLQRALEGEGNTTLVIADKRGRLELGDAPSEPAPEPRKRAGWKVAAEVAGAGVLAFLLWMLATLR